MLNIISHWREKGNDPFVAKKTIASRAGKDPRTIQEHLKSLCAERDVVGYPKPIALVTRKDRFDDRRQLASRYNFDGLVDVLKVYASEELERRKPK